MPTDKANDIQIVMPSRLDHLDIMETLKACLQDMKTDGYQSIIVQESGSQRAHLSKNQEHICKQQNYSAKASPV